jgi:hypothetical protein
MTVLFLGCALLAASIGSSCAPIDTDNAGDSASVQLALSADPVAGLVAKDSDGVPFALEVLRVAVDKVTLELPKGAKCPKDAPSPDATCDDTLKKIEVKGPFVVDLVSGQWSPGVDPLQLPFGIYETVEITLTKAKSDWPGLDPADPLIDASVHVAGTFVDGAGVSQKYRLTSDVAIRLTFMPDNQFEVFPASDLLMNLGLNASIWFRDAPLAACAANSDFPLDADTVVIQSAGAGDCTDVDKLVEEAVKASTAWSHQ